MLAAKETHQIGTGLTSFVTPFFIPMTFALATRVESPDLVEQSTLSSSSSKKLMMVMNDGVGRFLSGCFSELICRLRSLLDDLHGMLHVNLRSGSFSIGT